LLHGNSNNLKQAAPKQKYFRASTVDNLTLRLWDEGSQQDAENKAKTYNEHL